jgi:hypothetical protein
MRYFSYNDFNEKNEHFVMTVSEDHIRETYYDYWLTQIEKKYGDDHDFSFPDCVDDWCVINWAWEVKL